ncbi:GNAT family N-acetyltransferase [Microvirga sp. GCM10011540]|uniref:GNAT family N-acetyltransferase n=1 Tax=Microvirga sp. GCM10011540 TaxID=3317338 RepID=UPI00361388A9
MESLRTIVPESGDVGLPYHELVGPDSARFADLSVITSVDDLASYTADLEDLASDLAVQNPSYEPWVLLPIIRASAERRSFVFVLAFESHRVHGRRLVGFFPFERISIHSLMPVSCLRLWADPFNYLNARCDPLIRCGNEACIQDMLNWFTQGGAHAELLNLRGLTDGTSIATAVSRYLSTSKLTHTHSTIESHLYRRHADARSYMDHVFSTKSQQTLRRYERRLRELGPIEYSDVTEHTDIEVLADEFIDLEDRGWKGQQGVSVASYGHRDLVKGLLLEAHRRNRLSLLTLRIAKKIIAARCVVLAKPGSFLFKLTYDESETYSKRSPGLLLELEAIRRMHSDGELLGHQVEWMDTCASPYSSIFGRSRSDALKVHRFLVARPRTIGAIMLAMLPHMLILRDALRTHGSQLVHRVKAWRTRRGGVRGAT